MRRLKISYVLDRSKSIKLLPTYQRLIKKPRLSKIRKFIENSGYFANSVIASIDSGGKKIRFDTAGSAIDGSASKMGVLYLPPQFRSIYIIDGQHRLYSYSDS